MPPKPGDKKLYEEWQRRKGELLRDPSGKYDEIYTKEKQERRDARAEELRKIEASNKEKDDLLKSKTAAIALQRDSIAEKRKNAVDEKTKIDAEKASLDARIKEKNDLAEKSKMDLEEKQKILQGQIAADNLLAEEKKNFCNYWMKKIQKDPFVINKFNKDDGGDFMKLLQGRIDIIRDLIKKASTESTIFAKLQASKLVDIDNEFLNYLSGDEYKNLIPVDQRLVRDTIQQLIVNQMRSIMIILCKPVIKIKELVPYPEIIEREIPIPDPRIIDQPEEIEIPELIEKQVPKYIIPGIFDDTLDKMREINRIKQIHMEDDLKDSYVYGDRDATAEPAPVEPVEPAAAAPAPVEPVAAPVEPAAAPAALAGGGKSFKKLVYKTYKNLFLLHKYKI